MMMYSALAFYVFTGIITYVYVPMVLRDTHLLDKNGLTCRYHQAPSGREQR